MKILNFAITRGKFLLENCEECSKLMRLKYNNK